MDTLTVFSRYRRSVETVGIISGFILQPHQHEADLAKLGKRDRGVVTSGAQDFTLGVTMLKAAHPKVALNRFLRAEAQFSQVSGFEQSAILARQRQALALIALDRSEEALEILEAIVSEEVELLNFPNDLPDIYWTPVTLHQAAGRPDSAFNAAQALIRRLASPETEKQLQFLVMAYLEQAKILLEKDEPQRALAAVNAALAHAGISDDEGLAEVRSEAEQLQTVLLTQL